MNKTKTTNCIGPSIQPTYFTKDIGGNFHEVKNLWNIIDNAPKDGTWIWGYIPPKVLVKGNSKKFNSGRMLAVKWRSGPIDNKMHQPLAYAIKLVEERGGFWTAHPNGRKPTEGMPTHWMSLPEMPQ